MAAEETDFFGSECDAPVCKKCRASLSKDETAIYRRLIYRAAASDDCLCRSCLALFLEAPVSAIDEKIAHFKAAGCTLFN